MIASPLALAGGTLPAPTVRRYRAHAVRRSWTNFASLRRRGCAGYIASMHQSGTHWLKYMLACALAARYAVPPPAYNHANDIIGGLRDPVVHAHIPRLLSSHSIAHPLLASAWLRRYLAFPPHVVLVRDIRASLVSNYEKWKERYRCDFSEFLAGDPAGHRYNSDLWWCLRFQNAWGAVTRALPQATLVVRYEDIQHDAAGELRRLSGFLRLDLGADHLAAGVAAGSKEAMAQRHDPGRIAGEVRADPRPPSAWFGAAEDAYLRAACARLLRYRYGYDYELDVPPA